MGGISDKINKIVETILRSSTWTSAGDTRVQNFLSEFRGFEDVDFEAEIEKIIDDKKEKRTAKKTDEVQLDTATKKKIDKHDETLMLFKGGNVGQLQGFSSEQFGNIRSFASDPFGFVMAGFLKKFKTGLGILFITAIATAVVKFMISELFAPGRPLDTRFREIVDKQIIKFLDRKEQQELKQGFKSIITTTQGGLRGGSLRGQIGGNFITPGRIPSANVQQAAESRQPFDAKTDPVVQATLDVITVAAGPIGGAIIKTVSNTITNFASRNPNSIDMRRKTRESMSEGKWRASFGGFGHR